MTRLSSAISQSMTGGRMYNAPNAARGVEALTAEIARGLKTQYLVGFKSTRPEHDWETARSQSEGQFS